MTGCDGARAAWGRLPRHGVTYAFVAVLDRGPSAVKRRHPIDGCADVDLLNSVYRCGLWRFLGTWNFHSRPYSPQPPFGRSTGSVDGLPWLLILNLIYLRACINIVP